MANDNPLLGLDLFEDEKPIKKGNENVNPLLGLDLFEETPKKKETPELEVSSNDAQEPLENGLSNGEQANQYDISKLSDEDFSLSELTAPSKETTHYDLPKLAELQEKADNQPIYKIEDGQKSVYEKLDLHEGETDLDKLRSRGDFYAPTYVENYLKNPVDKELYDIEKDIEYAKSFAEKGKDGKYSELAEKEISSLEKKKYEVLKKRHRAIDESIYQLKNEIENGVYEEDGNSRTVNMWGSGQVPVQDKRLRKLTEEEIEERKSQIKKLERQKGLFFNEEESAKEVILDNEDEVKELIYKGLIPKEATLQDAAKILLQYKDELLKKAQDDEGYNKKGIVGKIERGVDFVINNVLGADKREKEIKKLQEDLRTIAPVALLNRSNINNKQTVWDILGKEVFKGVVPMASPLALTNKDIVEATARSFDEIGIDVGSKDVSKFYGDVIDAELNKGGSFTGQGAAEATGQTIGFLLPFMLGSGIFNAALRTSKYGRGIQSLAKTGRLGKEGSRLLHRLSSRSEGINRILYQGLVGGGEFATTGLISDKDEEAFFEAGLIGGMGGGAFETAINAMFGNKAKPAISLLSRYFGKAAGEVVQEFGEETAANLKSIDENGNVGRALLDLARNSDKWNEFKAEYKKQFPNMKEASWFVLQTMLMGAVFNASELGGLFTKEAESELKKLPESEQRDIRSAFEKLNGESRQIIKSELDGILNSDGTIKEEEKGKSIDERELSDEVENLGIEEYARIELSQDKKEVEELNENAAAFNAEETTLEDEVSKELQNEVDSVLNPKEESKSETKEEQPIEEVVEESSEKQEGKVEEKGKIVTKSTDGISLEQYAEGQEDETKSEDLLVNGEQVEPNYILKEGDVISKNITKEQEQDNSSGVSESVETEPTVSEGSEQPTEETQEVSEEQEKLKDIFGNLDEETKESLSNNPIKIVEDEAENKHAESRLSEQDNVEQEPSIKAIESKAENTESTSTEELEETKSEIDEKINQATGVENKNVSEITTDESRFQGRSGLNERVVSSIANKWSDADQDPIHIWTDLKDGKTYVLSGHHRLEAAKRAGRETVKIQDRTNDFTEEEAIKFAKEEANANRTMETPLERAITLRGKRENGDSKSEINDFIDNEGKNGRYVNNLSHLNPNGKTVAHIKALENSGDKKTQKESEKIADWIGEARRKNKNLTDEHENEMYDFLMDKKSSGRITTKSDFLSKINSLASDMYFDEKTPLNLKRFKNKNDGEKQYEQDVKEVQDEIKAIENKIDALNSRFSDPNTEGYVNPETDNNYDEKKKIRDEKVSEYNKEIKSLQKKLQKIYQDKGKYTKRGADQTTLFQSTKEGSKNKSNNKKRFTPISKRAFDKIVNLLKKAFPNVEVVTDKAEFDKNLKNGVSFSNKNGEIYGFVKDGKVYIDGSKMNANTPIHEFGHIWINAVKKSNPNLYKKGIDLISGKAGKKYVDEVKSNPEYSNLSEEQILEEALALAIGDKGEAMFGNIKDRFKQWLSRFWGNIRKKLGIGKSDIQKVSDKDFSELSLEDFSKAVVKDLTSGNEATLGEAKKKLSLKIPSWFTGKNKLVETPQKIAEQSKVLYDGISNYAKVWKNSNPKGTIENFIKSLPKELQYIDRRLIEDAFVNKKHSLEDFGGVEKNHLFPNTLKKLDRLRYSVQDFMIGVKRLQDAIKEAKGMMPDSWNFYQKKELEASKIAEHLQKIKDEILGVDKTDIRYKNKKGKSLVERMNKKGISTLEFGEYLHAKHAQSFNDRAREIKGNENLESPSGMSDERAKAILDKYDKEGKTKDLEAFAKEFREKVIIKRLDILKDAGIIDLKTYNTLKDGKKEGSNVVFDNYVPLKVMDSALQYDTVYSRGLGRKGKGINSIKGTDRFNEVNRHNPFFAAINDLMGAIEIAERNNTLKSLSNLIQNNKEYEIGEVVSPKITTYIDDEGNVKIDKDFTKEEVKQNGIDYYVDGKLKYIHITNEAIKNAVLRDSGSSSDILRFIYNTANAFNTFKRAMLTGYNIDFIAPNLIRDIQDSLYNTSSVKEEFNIKKVRRKILKGIPSAIKAVTKHELGHEKGNDFFKYMQEAAENGMKMNWIKYEPLEDAVKSMEDRARRIEKGLNKKEKVLYPFKQVGKYVMLLNSAAENATRLATYKALRESGLTPEQAASAAKNISINFEKKGDKGALINGLYLFANAGIQGVARGLKTAKSKEGRKYMLGIFTLSLLNAALNDMMSDDDDENYLNDGYLRENNTLLFNPLDPKNPIKIPKPYSVLRVPMALGEYVYDVAADKMTIGDAVGKTASTAYSTLDPIAGNSKNIVSTAIPTVLRPLAEVKMNKDWQNNYIVPTYIKDNDSKLRHEYVNYKTPKNIENATKYIYKNTGVNLSPAGIHHLTEGYIGGGAPKVLSNTISEIYSTLTNEEKESIDRNKLMIVRRFYGDADKQPWRKVSFLNSKIEEGNKIVAKKKLTKKEIENIKSAWDDVKKDMHPTTRGKMKKAFKEMYDLKLK